MSAEVKNKIYSFTFKTDYRSPNAALKNNNLVYKQFKAGDVFVGKLLTKQNSNIGKTINLNATFIDADNWLVPYEKLSKPTGKYDSFEEYNKEKKTIKATDFPPEIQDKINDIAQKNMAKNMGKALRNNMNLPLVVGGGAFLYAFATKKNVYMYTIGGVVAGIFLTMFKLSAPTTKTKLPEAKGDNEKEEKKDKD